MLKRHKLSILSKRSIQRLLSKRAVSIPISEQSILSAAVSAVSKFAIRLSDPAQQEYANFENKLSNAKILGIISIVMAFVTPFIGIILGIIGLVNVSDVPISYVPLEEKRKSCKMLNTLGIVLPFVWVAAVLIICALFFTTAFSTIGSMI